MEHQIENQNISKVYPYAELKVYLDDINTLPLLSVTQRYIETINNYLNGGSHNKETREVTQEVLKKIMFIQEQVNHLNAVVTQNKELASQRIEEIKQKNEKRTWEVSFKNMTLASVLSTFTNRPTAIVKDFISNRINLHSSWQFPALCIGDRGSDWAEEFNSADPLYITDFKEELVNIATSCYSQAELRRVKHRVSPEYDLSYYPKGQLGCVLVWEVFEYLKESTIKDMLKQIYDLLCDGGVVIFSFNNIDDLKNAAYPTKAPTSKTGLVSFGKSIGFTMSASFDQPGGTYVLEFQKPGVRTSNKLSVALGEISRKDLSDDS